MNVQHGAVLCICYLTAASCPTLWKVLHDYPNPVQSGSQRVSLTEIRPAYLMSINTVFWNLKSFS